MKINVKLNVEKFKKTGIWIFSILAVFYFIFLLVIPNAINLNKYKPQIQKIVYDTCKFKIDFNDVKLVTTLSSGGIKLNDLNVSYQNNEQIFNVNSAKVRIKLLPLIFKRIILDEVKLVKPDAKLNILADDRFELEKYISQNLTLPPADENKSNQKPLDFKFELKKFRIQDYQIKCKDLSNSLTVKGDEIVISNFILNEKVKIEAKGDVYSNETKKINYDIAVDTFLPEMIFEQSGPKQNQEAFIFNPVKIFKNSCVSLNVQSKLKIRDKNGLDIKGYANVDNIIITLKNQTIPESFVDVIFSGKKASIDSNLNVAKNEKAVISGNVNYGEKPLIDLSLKTDKINMNSIQNLITRFLDSFSINHEGSQITSNGYMQADLNLKTNLKEIQSNGFFNIVNASFNHKKFPATIKNMYVNLDFSSDSLKIKKCQAYLNDVLFKVVGDINNKAVANININTKNLQLAKLYTAFAPKMLQNTITIQNGLLTLNVDIKGKLDKIQPKILLSLSDFKMNEKTINAVIKQKTLNVNLIANAKGYVGTITQLGEQISIPGLIVNNPKSVVDFDNKKITINKFNLYLNSSPISIYGQIDDYLKKCDIDINAVGNLKTFDIAKVLPKEVKPFVMHKGQLPVTFSLKGHPKKLAITGNISANGQNYFSPIVINNLLNKQSDLKLNLELENNKLIIKNIGLYDKTSPLAKINGAISGLDKNVQNFDELKIILPKSLTISTPVIKNSTAHLKGALDVTGTVLKPQMNGNFYLTNVLAPDLKTSIRRIALDFSKMDLNVKIEGANVYSSLFDLSFNSNLSPSNIFTISKMTIDSLNIDADKLFVVLEKLTKMTIPTSASTSSAPTNIPVVIKNANAKIDKFKMGDITVSNIKGAFNLHNNLLKIPNYTLNAYDGAISGNATYNLITTAVGVNAKGSGIDANKIVTTFAKIKNQVTGIASFNTNVTLKGVTYNEQVKTLKGKANFEVKNGQFGSLGKFENFIKAPNIISQSFIRTSIGTIVNNLAPYNSGQFDTLKGSLTFSNGIAHISNITSHGSNMSMLMTGNFNLLNNNTNMVILGRISSKISSALGPLSQLTSGKITKYIPTYGKQALSIFMSLTDKSNVTELNKIPKLTSNSSNTQEFKVVLNGNVERPATLIRSFKWLSTASEIETTKTSVSDILYETYGNILDNAASSVVKSVSQSEKVQNAQKNVQKKIQKVQQSETAQKVQKFGNFLKEISEY